MTGRTLTAPTPSRPRTVALSGANVIVVATVVVALVACLTVDNFATGSNVRALLLSVSLTGIAAVGLSLVTIAGQVFSLSIASTIAVGTIAFAKALGAGAWPALLAACGLGLLIGVVQGVVVGRLHTNPIITTIAFSAVLLGLGQLWTDGRTVVGEGGASVFDSNLLGFLPFQVLAFLVITAAVHLWHRCSTTGRRTTLIGLNARAAEVSGTRTWPVVLTAFAISGVAAGAAAGLLAAQSGQGNLQLGGTFGFDVVVAVVVGGVAVNGGAGTPVNAAAGALFVGLLGNTLALAGLSYENQLVVKGLLVLLAVIVTGATAGSREGRAR